MIVSNLKATDINRKTIQKQRKRKKNFCANLRLSQSTLANKSTLKGFEYETKGGVKNGENNS